MSYLHHPYQYTSHAAVPIEQHMQYEPAMAHPSMVHPMDGYLYPHPPFDMVDFYPHHIMDYDEYAENLSRPRLTKEQVETLEAQFQAHPKPSSNVKRQLAAQTNLSLPRVANWFQNRRAKAKQQKRQAEFERMQAKAKADEAARSGSEDADQRTDSSEKTHTPTGESGKTSTTPKQSSDRSTSGDRTQTPARSASRGHKKTNSESAREATFASLQRALNAAVAARENYSPEQNVQPHAENMEPSVSASSMYSANNKSQTVLNPPFSEWESTAESSIAWTPSQSPEETFPYSNANAATSFSSVGETLSVTEMESPRQQNSTSDTAYLGWGQHVQAPGESVSAHNALQYSSLPQSAVGLSRRESSDELAESLGNIGINHVSQFPQRTDGASWKEAGKELDLAARRKRPRPAAIGTSSSCRTLTGSSSMSSMSPTTRMPGFGAGHGVRQSKSAQSLNSRYAGVRKASTAQRSPLNFSTFAEAGALSAAKAEMLQPSVSASNLAPPTPLTPEDLQHLIPASPSDGGYCLSAHPTRQFFPTTQPMQINIASPPSTPLAVDMMAPFQYQTVAPPMSAPAHYTAFPDYTTADGSSLTARSWADAAPVSAPDTTFQNGVQMHRPSITFEDSMDQSEEHPETVPGSGSPPVTGEVKQTEFLIHEFPEQQEAHRYVAQQLPAQPPKNYTFNNHTASFFES